MARNTAVQDSPAVATDGANPAHAFVGQMIERAESLIAAKREVQSQIGEIRDTLGTIVNQGLASDDQADWIANNLPKRQRGVKDNGETAETETTTDTDTEN